MIPFFKQSIRSRVIGVLETRIANAQEGFDESCKRFDEQCDYAIKQAKQQRDDNKAALADEVVNDILGKIL